VEVEIGGSAVLVEANVLSIKAVVAPRTPRQTVLPVRALALDRDRDLALLHVAWEPEHHIEPAPDLDAALMDEVVVIGFPFGELLALDSRGRVSERGGYPEASVSSGRITSLRRDDGGQVVAIQTDADINPGNSGGPMVDPQGRLVGVVYAEVSGGAQIGFAVAPRRVLEFVDVQRFRTLFDPPWIAPDGRPVVVTVKPGHLVLGDPAAARAVLEGPSGPLATVDLKAVDDEFRGLIEVPAGSAARYTVDVTLTDAADRQLAMRRYVLRAAADTTLPERERQPAHRIIHNELSIQEYARMQAGETAAATGQELSSPETRRREAEDAAAALPDEAQLEALEDLRARGRAHYKAGNYEVAEEFFAQIVAVDPTDEVARDYLELARERIALGEGLASDRAASGPATVLVTFRSPLKKGSLRLLVDGTEVADIALSRTTVEHRLQVEPGAHELTVQVEVKGSELGARTFSQELAPGSTWTLGVQLPSPDAEASFYLVERTD
jgi:hypothetical protein